MTTKRDPGADRGAVAAIRDKDAARAMATLADDIVAFELAPPLALGPDQARDEAGLAAWLAGWEGPVGIEIRDLHIAASGDVGWSRSLNRLHGTLKDGRRGRHVDALDPRLPQGRRRVEDRPRPQLGAVPAWTAATAPRWT